MATRPVRRRAPARTRRRRRAGASRGWAGPLAIGLILLAFLGIGIDRVRREPPPRHHLTMDEARAFNAAIPFVPGKLEPAPRFVFHGTPAGREQATECLATVALYEAGDDVRGQRAVMQVVLNRVRARGFPKTVCGVVYQGAGLPTGCQFSFACDGSVKRRPETAGWEAARARAKHALAGAVFAPVGTATHYHTDWVVPYWSGSLSKIAKVDTHIFYRRPSS
jgi:spore germination cell wall hydrolase CwlJ-like protein